jgi:hypothetical protein
MVVPHIAGITDEELIVYAMREAQLILAEHIERRPRDPEETITLLLDILDRQDVVAATDRLCRGYARTHVDKAVPEAQFENAPPPCYRRVNNPKIRSSIRWSELPPTTRACGAKCQTITSLRELDLARTVKSSDEGHSCVLPRTQTRLAEPRPAQKSPLAYRFQDRIEWRVQQQSAVAEEPASHFDRAAALDAVARDFFTRALVRAAPHSHRVR